MKHIGIIGVSAEGAALCFQTICAEAARANGNHDHPEITLHEQSSQLYFDAQPDWGKVAELLLISAKKLASLDVDFAIIPSNTMHFALPLLRKRSSIPLLSIVEVSVEECLRRGFKRVGILGTKLTMEGKLYDEALMQAGIEAVLPSPDARSVIDRIIFEEIVPAKVNENTVPTVLSVIENLKNQGAQAVILGCTELPIIVHDGNSPIPTIDTTRLLAKAAVKEAME